MIKTEELKANICISKSENKWELYNIIDTPHYQFLLGKQDDYIKYTTKIYPTPGVHDKNTFTKLIQNLDHNRYNSCNKNLVKVRMNNKKQYQISDGIHRASILFKNNIKNIKIQIK